MSRKADPAPSERECVLCDRRGARGFKRINGKWFCASLAACERRQRRTGQVGVGIMRNYVR